MRGARTLATALVLGGALLTGGGAVIAQDATPGAVDLSPDPDQCALVPRTLENIESLSGTPSPTLDASAQPVELPTGEPAPKEAIDGVVATVVQSVACFNAGNYLALFAGWTDAYLLTQIGTGPFDQSALDQFSATPTALPEAEQTQLLDTRDFTLYPDGRVGVLVYYKTPTTDQTGTDSVNIDLWIFKEVDGVWLLDEDIVNLEGQLKDKATPAAG